MPRWEDQVFDEYRRPVAGADVYVFTNDGITQVVLTDDAGAALANPVETDAFGSFYFNVATSGIYQLEVHYAGETEYKQTIYVGTYNVPDGAIGTAKLADGAVTSIKIADGTIATADLADNSVSLAKMADVATGTVFYRKSAGTGDPETQPLATLKTDLGLTGTNSGDQTITLTGDVTGSGTGSINAQIAADAVGSAEIATGAVGATELANGAIEAKLGFTPAANTVFTSVANGLAPASGGGAVNFLRADGTWAVPPGTAAVTAVWGNITGTLSNQTDLQTALNGKAALVHTHVIGDVTGLQAALDGKQVAGSYASTALVSTSAAGLAPTRPGGTTAFLRADGTWAAPPGGGGGLTDGDYGDVVVGGTGTTMAVQSLNGESGSVNFKTGASNFGYFGFYTKAADQSARQAWMGFGNPGAADFNFRNEMGASGLFEFYLNGAKKLAISPNDVIAQVPIYVPDEAYGAAWDGSLQVPTKNALYDKIEALTVGGGGVTTFNTRSGAVVLTAADVSAAGANAFAASGLVNANGSLEVKPIFRVIASNNTAKLTTYSSSTNFYTEAYDTGDSLYKPITLSGSDIMFNINGVQRGYFSPTGLAVTGNITATGTITSGGSTLATVSQLANYLPLTGGTLSGDVTVSKVNPLLHLQSDTGNPYPTLRLSGGGLQSDISGFGGLLFDMPTSGAANFRVNYVSIATINATGLAVTGAITATGAITSGGSTLATVSQLANYLPLTGGDISGQLIFSNSGNQAGRIFSNNPWLVHWADNYAFSNKLGTVDFVTLNSTGLAVTGTITATGQITGAGLKTSTGYVFRADGNPIIGSVVGGGQITTLYSNNTGAYDFLNSGNISKVGFNCDTGLFTFLGNVTVTDEAYGGTWDGSTQVPTKNAVYDKIQTLVGGAADGLGPDGNKGDITVGGTGTTLQINAGAVALADMANLAANSFLGNNTGSAATPIALTLAQSRTLLALTTADVAAAAGFVVSCRAVTGAGAYSEVALATSTVLGRGSSGNIVGLTLGANLTMGASSFNVASVPNALTFNNGGAGAASGTTFNGSAAQTISYNSIGAQPATPPTATSTSNATLTPDSTKDMSIRTTQTVNLTVAAPSGTPVDAQGHVLRIKATAAIATVSWNATYRAVGVTLPLSLVSGKTTYVGMIWNALDSFWDVVSVATQA